MVGKSETSQGKASQASAKGLTSLGDVFAGEVGANLSSSTVIFFPAAGRFLPVVWLYPKDRQKSVQCS